MSEEELDYIQPECTNSSPSFIGVTIYNFFMDSDSIVSIVMSMKKREVVDYLA